MSSKSDNDLLLFKPTFDVLKRYLLKNFKGHNVILLIHKYLKVNYGKVTQNLCSQQSLVFRKLRANK